MTTDIRFVPDSNIIYPSIFLANVEKIGLRASRCRDCFDLLKKSHIYVILPANKTDFGNLILKKFGRFLGAIELEITNARQNNAEEKNFYRATFRRLQSYGLDKDDKDFGNLMLFWFSHKELFWSFVSKDETLTKTRMTMMTLEKMGEYAKVCEGHEETFSENEQNLGEGLYKIIKKARNDQKFSSFANDADLLILAQCFIYKDMRYDGFMYLLTDDYGLHGITNEIVSKPKIIFPDFKDTERYQGFEPIKPERFMVVFKGVSTKKQDIC